MGYDFRTSGERKVKTTYEHTNKRTNVFSYYKNMYVKAKFVVKHAKKVAVVCLVLGCLHVLYSSTGGKRAASVSKLRINYRLMTYYENVSDRFKVLEKSYRPEDIVAGKEKGAGAVNAANQEVVTIEGYEYGKMERLEREQAEVYARGSGEERLRFETTFVDRFADFFNTLFMLIQEHNPKIEKINNDEHYLVARSENKFPNRDGRVMLYGGHLRENYIEEPVRTKEMLSNYLRLSKDEVAALANTQRAFVEAMPTEYPSELLSLSKFNRFLKGDGIVYLGGGRYNQLVLLSLKVLRAHGSKLPVEVIIPKRLDYDIDLCTIVLPTMNASCKIMSDFLPAPIMAMIGGFQYKTVALLISSFENVLYLDADNIPVKNVDSLFNNKPFTDQHLVIWPDLWRRSTSPDFYDISDIPYDINKQVRNSYFPGDHRGSGDDKLMHDCDGAIAEASSETGQILINKKVHFKTMVLSMYYNFYGPQYYYSLLSQGAAGEGDKETFIAAAHKLKLPYYQVQEFNREFGPINPNTGKHEYYGMGQYDPILDYIQSSDNDKYLNQAAPTYARNDNDNLQNNYNYHKFKYSNLLFLHANWPKFYVSEMFLSNSYGRGPKADGAHRRMYDSNLIEELNGYDFELQLFQDMHWCYCYLLSINLIDVPNSKSPLRRTICDEINQHVDYLRANK